MTRKALSSAPKLKPSAAPAAEPLPFRQPPHNIEAEQALLGAILVNNEALDRVSAFLEPAHFFDPLHASIYEITTKLIQAGKQATPVTLKTFFENAEPIGPRLTVPQYLGRLAASATTIINASHYGRTVHDLATRRSLIMLGEEVVNTAYDSPVDLTPKAQIEAAEGRLYELAETDKYGGGFLTFGSALTTAIEMANNAYQRAGHLSGLATGLSDLDSRMGGLQSSDLVIIAGRPSMGKAQPLDAKVLTKMGWKPMGELRLGDHLASIDGRPSRVSGLFPQGEKQIYRITFSDGRSTECCAEHLWRVHYREWEAPLILTTAQLIEKLRARRYQGRLWIDTFSGDFGHDEALPIDPWVLGALLGDGSLSGGSVRFSTSDAEQVERLTALAGGFTAKAIGGYDYRICTAGGHHRHGTQGVAPNAIKENLRSLGLWGLRSEDKFVPPSYLTANRTTRLDVLRGLLDTDGWVETWGSVRFCSSSRRLAENVVDLVRSLGGTCGLHSKTPHYTYRGERKQGLPTYVVNISVTDAANLFLLPRKIARTKPSERTKRVTFASIEPTRIAPAQCISVTHPDRLYITDDYIVTHNTALATNIAYNIARNHKTERQPDGTDKVVDGAVVGFFSLEMSAEQLATRILSEQAEIPSEKIRRGMIDENDFRKLVSVSQEMSRIPLYIDQTGGISVAQLAARARKLKRQKGLGLLVVDYLQLLTGSSRNSRDNRVQEITEITTGLKALAKELNVPVIALSQLSRQVEQRDDKRPQLSDLRESGSIEQDADVVMFVFREEYYVERKKPTEGTAEFMTWQQDMERVHGKAEAIIAKQRHGPTGTVQLSFEGRFTRFGNLAHDERMPERFE